MPDGSIPTSRVVVVILWTAAFLLFVASWWTWFAGADTLPMMLGLSGCTVVAGAAVAQIRRYSSRICSLIRVSSGMERPDVDLHTVR